MCARFSTHLAAEPPAGPLFCLCAPLPLFGPRIPLAPLPFFRSSSTFWRSSASRSSNSASAPSAAQPCVWGQFVQRYLEIGFAPRNRTIFVIVRLSNRLSSTVVRRSFDDLRRTTVKWFDGFFDGAPILFTFLHWDATPGHRSVGLGVPKHIVSAPTCSPQGATWAVASARVGLACTAVPLAPARLHTNSAG